mmetsp:Transcript_138121/g.441312  ORF Transcript_138121/g.441312 Transcript_138121/m.441312 type:complete len:282 (+) Transcript_138121:2232-3077(+)
MLIGGRRQRPLPRMRPTLAQTPLPASRPRMLAQISAQAQTRCGNPWRCPRVLGPLSAAWRRRWIRSHRTAPCPLPPRRMSRSGCFPKTSSCRELARHSLTRTCSPSPGRKSGKSCRLRSIGSSSTPTPPRRHLRRRCMRLSLPSRPSMKTLEAGRSRQVPRLLVTCQLKRISKQPTWRQQLEVVEPGQARTAAAMAVAVTPLLPPSAEAKAEIEAEAAATMPLAPTVAMPTTAATEEAVHRSIGHQSERGTHRQLCFPSPPRAARPRSGLMRRTRRRRSRQ